MGLGEMLFGKKSKTPETSKISNASVSRDAKVFSGGVYKTEKELRGKLGSLETMKVKGSLLKKEEWAGMMTDLVKKRNGAITIKQMERDLYLKKGIPQKERQRIMTWAKKNFVSSSGEIKQVNDRSARIIKADTGEKFVSPKDKQTVASMRDVSGANSLGMANKGFQRGHGGGVAGMDTNKPRSVEKNQSQGMVQPGNAGLTRNAPRNVADSNINSSPIRRPGGLQ